MARLLSWRGLSLCLCVCVCDHARQPCTHPNTQLHTRACVTWPDFGAAWYNLGVIQEERGELGKAETALTRYLELVESSGGSGGSGGNSGGGGDGGGGGGGGGGGDNPQECDPTPPKARALLGDLLHRRDAVEPMQRLFQRAVGVGTGEGAGAGAGAGADEDTCDTHNPTNWLMYGVSLQLGGRLIEAKFAYEQAMALDRCVWVGV